MNNILRKSGLFSHLCYLQILFDKLLRTSWTIEGLETSMHEQVFTQLCLIFVRLFAEFTLETKAGVNPPKMLIQSAYITECGRTQRTNIWSFTSMDFQMTPLIPSPDKPLRTEITTKWAQLIGGHMGSHVIS
jgi:hypothetical protein